MTQLPERKRMKGVGRVAFMAQLAEITADLEAGWPIKAVYQKCADKLGMSYAQFARYVDQIVRRGNLARAPRLEPPPPPLPSDEAVPPATPSPQQGIPRAGCEPARRSFNHDPIERPDDRRRLLGEE